MNDYFSEAKKRIEEQIPDFESPDFKKMGDSIRKELQQKEAEMKLVMRSIKTLVLGDWSTNEKKERLMNVRNTLLRNGFYAETIDKYYDMNLKGGLSQAAVFETCCIHHQLVVFIDGEGAGTVTEQNYLSENYALQGKVIFLIEEGKFSRYKDNPGEYIGMFPTIITYKEGELSQTALAYARFRIYRLTGIIMKQAQTGKGMYSPNYQPWEKRLHNKRRSR
ncbi:MAG: hypothetical protein AABW99_01535 [archaeon]